MVEVSGKIEGLEELAKNSKKLSKSFDKNVLRAGLRGAIKPVERRAKAHVPQDEGDLHSAIKSRARVYGNGRGSATVGYDRDIADYGGQVEVGTSDTPAQPFLRPALEESEQDATDAFITALNASIRRVLKRAARA